MQEFTSDSGEGSALGTLVVVEVVVDTETLWDVEEEEEEESSVDDIDVEAVEAGI